jgi:hypothetical protein
MNSKPTVSIVNSNAEPHDADRLDALSEVDAEIIRAIRNIRYGSVEITIHDSRVVQIERKEKRRFEASRRLG